MVRVPCCEKMGLKKGPWTPEEDQILMSYVQQYGHQNWRALPKLAGEYMYSMCFVSHTVIRSGHLINLLV